MSDLISRESAMVPIEDAQRWERAYRDSRDALMVSTSALRGALNIAVDRWHETCPNEERSLAEWLGLDSEEFASYVLDDLCPSVIEALRKHDA